MVETLAKEGQIHRAIFERKLFEITQPVLKILHAGLRGSLPSVGNHLFGIVYGDDAFRALCKQQR